MVWLSFLATLVLSALSGMGVGGGGLFVIYLVFTTELPQLTAQGMNLLFFLCSAGSSMLIHLQKRRILWKSVGILVAFGLLGVLVGTYLSGHVDEKILRKIFGILLVISGISSLKRQQKEKKPKDDKNIATKMT